MPFLPLIVIGAVCSQPGESPELPTRSREILTSKCAECHGPDLVRPKGKFGFVTDLTRLAASPQYIVPGEPEQSDLWNQIDSGDMPPRRAKNGPLTSAEKDTVFAWIKAGAPAPPGDPPKSAGPAGTASPTKTGRASPANLQARAVEMLGRLHVVVIHFPIALLALAALAEMWRRVRPTSQAAPVIRASLALGAVSAAIAAGLGWVHARDAAEAAYSTLWIHRWLGTVAAGVSVLALVAHETGRVRARSALLVTALIVLAATLAGGAGHFGGLVTHGPNFYSP